MGLFSYKTIIGVSLALMVVSALSGLAVYYMHVSVLKSLGGQPQLGDVLDRISSLEYKLEDPTGTYTVKVSNDPATRTGTIEVYKEGELVEKYYYEYGNNQLIRLEREVGEQREALDPVDFEEAFLTSVRFEVQPDAGITQVRGFPGVGPVYILYYLEGVIGVDWPQLLEPRGVAPPVNVSVQYVRVSSEAGSYFGARIIIQGQGPLAVFTPLGNWGLGPIVIDAAKIGGLPVAVKFQYTVIQETGEETVSWELVSLETR